MLKFTVKINMTEVLQRLNGLRDQVPFATALALTKTAQVVKQDLRQLMRSLFQAPTGFTLGSIYVERATKQNLMAVVGIKRGALSWQAPEIYGGERQKALEKSLEPLGLPPSGMWALPGSGAKFTTGKHISLAWVNKLVAAIAAGAKSSSAGASKKTRKGTKTYMVLLEQTGKLLPGIYQRTGAHSVLPLIVFVRAPIYRARFDFFGVAQQSAERNFPVQFDAAIRRAVATAR